MGKKRVFGELELAILHRFRNQGRLTVRDVLVALGSEDKYTTIMTVMNRMAEKKLLLRERVGQQYQYWINSTARNGKLNFLNQLKKKVFGGESASMVCYLLESSDDITDRELDAMEKLIRELKQSRKRP